MEDRRQYFRIQDSAFVLAKPFVPDMLSLQEYFPELRETALVQNLIELEEQAKELSDRLDDKPLTQFVRLLHKKIDLLSDLEILKNVKHLGTEIQSITLSEGGIGFLSDQAWQADQHIVVGMLFSPSYLLLPLKAHVIECATEGKAFRIHADFVDLPERTRQQLAKHLLAEQTRQHQMRKQD